jgi:hypothetical protein
LEDSWPAENVTENHYVEDVHGLRAMEAAGKRRASTATDVMEYHYIKAHTFSLLK